MVTELKVEDAFEKFVTEDAFWACLAVAKANPVLAFAPISTGEVPALWLHKKRKDLKVLVELFEFLGTEESLTAAKLCAKCQAKKFLPKWHMALAYSRSMPDYGTMRTSQVSAKIAKKLSKMSKAACASKDIQDAFFDACKEGLTEALTEYCAERPGSRVFFRDFNLDGVGESARNMRCAKEIQKVVPAVDMGRRAGFRL
jgi:hypothetical protein